MNTSWLSLSMGRQTTRKTTGFQPVRPRGLPRVFMLTVALLLLGSGSLHADHTFSKLWPAHHRPATHKRHSSFHTASFPKHTSHASHSSKATHWLPSFSSLASAPKKLWLGTKKIFTWPSKEKASSASRARSSRRKRLYHRINSKDHRSSHTVQDFLSKKRPTF